MQSRITLHDDIIYLGTVPDSLSWRVWNRCRRREADYLIWIISRFEWLVVVVEPARADDCRCRHSAAVSRTRRHHSWAGRADIPACSLLEY
eukprot:1195766-Prorocentrum_minimum.AAC.5